MRCDELPLAETEQAACQDAVTPAAPLAAAGTDAASNRRGSGDPQPREGGGALTLPQFRAA